MGTMTVTAARAAETLRLREQAQRVAARRRAEALLARLPAAKQILCGAYGAGSVVLFGSIARGDARPDSDVDLAVEGLPPAVYFAAVADLMAALGCTVDLVRLEEAPASLAERIAAEGRAL
jgi:predicted nucleotidyltransferase